MVAKALRRALILNAEGEDWRTLFNGRHAAPETGTTRGRMEASSSEQLERALSQGSCPRKVNQHLLGPDRAQAEAGRTLDRKQRRIVSDRHPTLFFSISNMLL
jgi:hypothetical protein